ncbi:hypothetical protein D3C74_447450 [compost metagenome]
MKIIKGIDHWTMFALSKAVRSRTDLVIPKKETLGTLFLLKDERSVLLLDIVKRIGKLQMLCEILLLY